MINTARLLWDIRLSPNSVLLILIGLIYNNPCTANNPWIIHFYSYSSLGRMGVWLSRVGWTSCVSCLYLSSPFKANKGMKPNSVITWAFLRSPLSIICVFSNGIPQPRAATACLGALLRPAIYIFIHRGYLYSCSLLHFLQTTLQKFHQCIEEGGVWNGNGLRGKPPYRCGWHHLPSFPLAGQQHLCCPYEMNVPSHLLGSKIEARSLSCPWSGINWLLHTNFKNSFKVVNEKKYLFCVTFLV